MATQATKTSEQAAETTLSLLQDLFGSVSERHFAVRLWDGTVWRPDPDRGEPPDFTLVLQHPGALRKMFLPPGEMSLAEAYIYNDFDIEGDIEAIFSLADQLMGERWDKTEQLRYGRRLLSLPKTNERRPAGMAAKLHGARHSRERDREAVSYHYEQFEQSNEFFSLFLDRNMLYTCAYFATPDDDIDTAQERKLDYMCRKLRLRPGERLLDLGCGWGGLTIYAAQHYGVEVHGVTLGRLQAEYLQKRIQEEGLTGRCHVELCDYRDINGVETFDKIAAAGIAEHVGGAMLPTYFKQAWRLLRPGGVFLNQAIASGLAVPIKQEKNFLGRYVFPDSEVVPISSMLRAAEVSGFEVRDVESLREHYVLTLRHWVRNLEARAGEVRTLTNDVTYRIYRLFTSGAAYGFRAGRTNLYQVLLAKPDRGDSRLPLTRADWYI